MDNTPYDNTFHTILCECSKLVLPMINEAFDENYLGNEKVEFMQNEHYSSSIDSGNDKIISDAIIKITDNSGDKRRYHWECQSTVDNSMIIRIFEYASREALQAKEVIGNELIVTFPHSAVLYLRASKSLSDVMKITIVTPGGSVSYNVPAMKLQSYSLDDIFNKNLLLLLPFYPFNYESKLKLCNNDRMALDGLLMECKDISQRVRVAVEQGTIESYSAVSLLNGFSNVIENLADKYENVKKGAMTLMEIAMLEYEAKTIYHEGREEGLKEGLKEGLEKGQEKANIEFAKYLLKLGKLSLKEIQTGSGLSAKQIEAIKREISTHSETDVSKKLDLF